MLTNARVLVKTILVFLLLPIAGAATAQNFSFENCRLLSLEKSIKFLFQGSLESGLKSYDFMSNKYFIHASPTLYNAGTNNPQLLSCFLLGIDDSINGIYKCFQRTQKINLQTLCI